MQDTKSALADLGQKRLDALGQANATKATQVQNLYEQMLGRKFTSNQNALNRQQQLELAAAAGLTKAGATGTTNKRVNSGASRDAGYLVDMMGRPILGADGKRIPVVKKPGTAGKSRLNTTASGRMGYMIDQYGNPMTNPDGSRRPYPKTGTTGGTGPGSPGWGVNRQRNFFKARKAAYNTALSLMKPPQQIDSAGNWRNPATGKLEKWHPPNWQQAHDRLWNVYAPELMQTYKYTRAAVEQMIAHALQNAKVKAPGTPTMSAGG